MGLFDKLLKGAVDAIDNAAAKNGNGPTGLKDLFNQAMGKKDEAINGTSSTTTSSKPSTATTSSSSKRSNCAYTRPTYHTSPEVLATGNVPAKPSRKVDFEIYDGEDGEIRTKVTFDLSGDFLDTDGDICYIASYLPNINDDDYDSGYSDDNTPLFGVVDAPDNKIYELIKKVENGGVPDDALMYLPVNDMGPYVCFKAKVEDRGRATYFYYCPLYEHCDLKCQFGVSYNSDSFGTPLEKKLMAAVDDTVMPGDEVVLIGKQGEEEIKVDELAELAGTIHYEILCGLRRIPRIFIDEK